MKIIDCKQHSTEWQMARLGIVTASEVDALVTPLWKTRTGEGVETYRYLKLCEKLINYVPPDFGTYHMEQGNVIETIARPWYAFQYDVNIATPGFCVSDDGKIGCSPDGLIGADCGLEIKAPAAPKHLKYLTDGVVPKEFLAQVHFSMLVTNRPKWVFVSFSRQFPPLVVNVDRDAKIDAALHAALEAFFNDFDPIYAKLKAHQDAENARQEAAYNVASELTRPPT